MKYNNIFDKLDKFLIKLINIQLNNKYFDYFFYHITDLGGALAITLLSLNIFFVGVLYSKRLTFIGIEMLVVLFITQSITQIIKFITKRSRPYETLEFINTFEIKMIDKSFPSGHTIASFSLFLILYLNYSNFYVYALIFAIIISISRIYLGLHYPTDVLFGLIFSWIFTFFIHYNMRDLILYVVDIIY